MNDANKMCDRLIAEFAESYMEKLFYFCLKKTGNNIEAEDLTQDVALNIITALNKGTIPTSFSAWVWQIARNRYSVWADQKRRRNESVTGSDIGDYEIEDESENILDEMIQSEQMSLLRRELAFIKSDYRNIVVAYYLENRSVRDIASSLSISVSAVQQRLHRARQILKEGMDMAREFGIRSYKPEEITFSKNGRDGKKGQPWSIVSHSLYKNIFLEAYENPQTAEELSLSLGIALPYMEDELKFLVHEQLLRKEGNKYQTDFIIISKEDQRKIFEANKKIQKPLTDKLCELIDTYMKEDGAKVNINCVGYETAKWALLVRTFDILSYSAKKNNGERNPYPSRPDDGAWVITGYEDIDWKEPRYVGQHDHISYDENGTEKEINYAQYKFQIYDHDEKTPDFLTYDEAYNLWLVCCGKINETEKAHIKNLVKYGYLKEIDGKIEPNVVIFKWDAEKTCDAAVSDKLTALRDEIYDLCRQVPNISRGYIVEQALENGWLKYDENTINTIGAYMYI